MFKSRLPPSTIARGPIDRKERPPRASEVHGISMEQAARAVQQEGAKLRTTIAGRDHPMNTYENRYVKQSYNISVFHGQEESHLFVNSPIFVNRPSTLGTQNDVITALGIPMINHYLELTMRDRTQSHQPIPGSFKRRHSNLDRFYTRTVQQFMSDWSFLGGLDEPPELASNYSEGGIIKPALNPKIGVKTAGVITLKQQFAQDVNTGDQLFYIVKPVISPYKCFYGWRGETLGPRTPSDTSFLQIMGFSDRDVVIPRPSTASDIMQPPLLHDSCGMALNSRIEQSYRIVEWDELNGFNIRSAEVPDVPDIIVDLWTEGHVIPVGVVQSADRQPVSKDRLLMSHRDVEKQQLLPNVNVARSS